jgi:hypothetical protein
LQTNIALSTMEAEYTALSVIMRKVLPFNHLVKAVATVDGLSEIESTTFNTTVCEDNIGALTLANLEQGHHTTRSKHYAIKMHLFHDQLKPNKIVVTEISTKDQQADIMTKCLCKDLFIVHCLCYAVGNSKYLISLSFA